ncbi:MAG TPA: sulfurtransferase [Bryobacteraceae bacterium]|nr:sulfurtransferase [Bryobacteraceae bacterium]
MRRLSLWFLLASLAAAQPAIGAPACGGHGDRNPLLVTTAWLADHLKDPNLVILAAGRDDEYENGHIPGSLPFTLNMVTSQNTAGSNGKLPPMASLAETFGKLGVTNDSHVILYMTKNSFASVTRTYLTLDAMGLGAHTSILDGGLPAWKNEKRPVTTEVPAVKPGKLDACAQNDVIASLDYVKSNLHHPGVDIIDVRVADDYSAAEARGNSRAGHIPGATSLPAEKLTDSGKLKPAAELQSLLREAGVKPGDRVVSYCYVGLRATVVYFVARYLGYDARLYDGSWTEWNKHTELPTEISAAK